MWVLGILLIERTKEGIVPRRFFESALATYMPSAIATSRPLQLSRRPVPSRFEDFAVAIKHIFEEATVFIV